MTVAATAATATELCSSSCVLYDPAAAAPSSRAVPSKKPLPSPPHMMMPLGATSSWNIGTSSPR